MAKKELKTNVMRVLDSKKLAYNHYAYDNSTVNGVEVARLLGQDPDLGDPGQKRRLFCVYGAGGRRTGSEKGGSRLRRKGGRNAAAKRAAAPHRLCARRLLTHWDEKAVPHLYPPNGGGL